jgi:hypothetical protein
VHNAAVSRRRIPSDGTRRLNRLCATDNMALRRPCPAAITLIPQRTARRHETVIKRLLQDIAEATLVACTARRAIWLGQYAFRPEDLDPTMRTGHASGNATDNPAFDQLNFIAGAANDRSSNCNHQTIMF